MKKIFRKLLLSLALFLVFPTVSFAEISQIVFITESQEIKPNEISEALTFQLQDITGSPFKTPETLDIQFISSSQTGQFLNNSGNPATTYMSKNTANKTFYYKDSSEGEFIITVNVRGRDTGIELGASQQIKVSSNATSNSSGEVLGDSTVTLSLSSGSASVSGGSTNQASSFLSTSLDISAGSDRVTSPGSPIWFQASSKKNISSSGLELSWSFGDGFVGSGPTVSHTYKYPGDYVVVLTARMGDIFSVSRLKVKVFEPNIVAVDKGEYLEIINNSNSEINLFNWKIENEGKGFVFQPNTIILPRATLKLDKSLLTMKGTDNSLGLSIKNSLKKEVFAVAPTKQTDLQKISGDLKVVEKEFSIIKEKAKNLGLTGVGAFNFANVQAQNYPVSISENNSNEVKLTEATSSSISNNIIYEAPKKESFFKRTWSFLTGLSD